jgi:hypothetical protein
LVDLGLFHIIAEACSGGKMFTSWWSESKEKERKELETKYTLQVHAPTALPPPPNPTS